jgi:hypothetical protein
MMELKGSKPTRIVTRMKRGLLLAVLLLVPALGLAQPFQFGVLAGTGRSMEEGFEFSFDQGVREVFFGARIDVDTMFNVKLGQTDTETGPLGESVNDGTIDYVLGQVEYGFDEVWGRSAVFAGPGAYRVRAGDLEDTNLGLAGGVNTTFPINRHFGLMLELAYHWVNFEEQYSFLTAAAGVRFAF